MTSRPGSLRFRLTAAATLVVAAVLAIFAFAVLSVQRSQLTATLDASLSQRADSIAEDIATGSATTLLNTNDEDRAVQVVSADGRVLAATSNLADGPALADSLTPTQAEVIETRADLPLEDDSYRVLTRRIAAEGGPALLHVAENSDDLEEAMRNLLIALSTTIPAVALALAALMWWLIGRTLAPVDRMRAEAESITATDSGQRIHVAHRDDEVGRLAVTLNRMLDRLTDATERQRRFVADAAHELRTPLTRIRTTLEVDLAHPENAVPSSTLAEVRQEAIELQLLVDDLLYLARSDAKQTPRRREAIDLDDLVMQEIRDLRAADPAAMIDSTRVSGAQVHGNADHLRRAIRNVLNNAARHARTRVTVTLVEDSIEIALSIADDGPGIPVEHRERIFQRFTRVEDARTRDDGGTGLGLAIARDIVEDHDGTITYDTLHGGEARFVIRIPTVQDQIPEP